MARAVITVNLPAGGLAERLHGYLERPFLSGRACAPADFNAQLACWLARADTRRHRSLAVRSRSGSAPARPR